MANVLTLTAENPNQLLNAGAYGAGAVIRLQAASAQGGPFADVSGVGSTPTVPLLADTRAYTAYDPSGASSTWYRMRYEDALVAKPSEWSDPFQIGTTGYADLVDVKQRFEKTDTDRYDEDFAEMIRQATDYIRGECNREFLPQTGVFLFDGRDARAGGRCLRIPQGIVSITTLEVADATLGSFSTISSPNFLLRPLPQDRSPGWPATELWMSDVASGAPPFSAFPRGYGNVQITGTLNFPALPVRINEVCMNIVARMWAWRQAGGADSLGAGQEGGVPSVTMFVSKRDRDTLARFALRHRMVYTATVGANA